MNKDIIYTGFATVPSDNISPDGQLAAAINCVNEDGGLRPVMPPTVRLRVPGGYNVEMIHKTSAYEHFIVRHKEGGLGWLIPPAEQGEPWDVEEIEVPSASFSELISINAIGNTLILLTDSGMHYILWRAEDQAYKYLGNQLPQPVLSFGLQSSYDGYEEDEITLTRRLKSDSNTSLREFDLEFTNSLSDAALAAVNKFVANVHGNGKFVFPFLVRYALRLYDGTLARHSAPVLMIPNSHKVPEILAKVDIKDTDEKLTHKLSVRMLPLGFVSKLDCLMISRGEPAIPVSDDLNEWYDVVKGIDIFVSAPIYLYKQSGKARISNYLSMSGESSSSGGRRDEDTEDDTDTSGGSPGAVHRGESSETEEGDEMNLFSIGTPLSHYRGDGVNVYRKLYKDLELQKEAKEKGFTSWVSIEYRSLEDIYEDIASTANFYLLHSFSIMDKDFPSTTERKAIKIGSEVISTLVTRERMSDDYGTNDLLKPSAAFNYNSRLNIVGGKRQLFNGSNPISALSFTNAMPDSAVSTDLTEQIDDCEIYYRVKIDGKIKTLYSGVGSIGKKSPIYYIYYPDPKAFEVIIHTSEGYSLLPMKQHEFLNGSFYFDGWSAIKFQNLDEFKSQHSELFDRGDKIIYENKAEVDIPNKIYTSEVNNPFVFPLKGINTVGAGEIYALSAAARPLSEGQFGQFPLYAFTDEGVWALEVSATGTYTARQPITRDVCNNPRGITQLDNSVVFPTARGIMHIIGSETRCITEAISSDFPFDVTKLPGLLKHFEKVSGHNPGDRIISVAAFSDFMEGCRVMYDYVGQRIMIYNKGYSYAYVYSMKSGHWGMMYSSIIDNLNSYPEALAVVSNEDGSKDIVDYGSPMKEGETAVLYVTRPLKLDSADILKTIDTVIQRGDFSRGDVTTILYGSRDMRQWHLVWSSKDHYLRGFSGSPYKYFVIASTGRLTADKSVTGASISMELRQTKGLK
ncbi:MAG: hypothetical protein K2H61_02805 [Muribaculaceae bacterium]|nr:hypothetical protein [Muribaculaceae bacterium]